MDLTGPQKVMLVTLIVLCVNYVLTVIVDKYTVLKANTTEGFEGSIPDKDNGLYSWLTDPQLIYDDFYAGVYDQLSQQAVRSKAKVAILYNLWKKDALAPPSSWSILDMGCGTGHAAIAWAKQGVGRIVGLDESPAMLRQAETVGVPAEKLAKEKLETLRWRRDTLINPSAAAAGEFTHAYCFYFTFYYLKDKEQFFRHAHLWTKPGAKLCVEVVNKHKFDPILESASPFVGFSLQKYSKERLRKSKVTFDKFDYEAEFVLTDPRAEFYETFRFKNGHVRRQKHEFTMPSIEETVAMGKRSGWTYIGFQDLNPIGFEYAYLLTFEKK